MVELKPITGSSAVVAAGYDSVSGVLAIRRPNSPHVYHYRGVSQEVASAFEEAESKGRFISQNINGKFDFERISADEEQQS